MWDKISGKRKKQTLILSSAIILFFSLGVIKEKYAAANNDVTASTDEFLKIKTDMFTILYEPSISPDRLYKKLNRRRLYFRKSTRPAPSSSPEEKIAFRINLILERVKEILGMYPNHMNFQIKFFRQQEPVTDAYQKITGQYRKVKAFYIDELKTIVTSEENVTDSVLAHEIAHLLQHYYFVAPPSDKVSEMLSMYVDTNLEE